VTGEAELRYDAAWKVSEAGRPLSLSLPFGVGERPLRGERVHHYFDNLLPDSMPIRRRIAAAFAHRVRSTRSICSRRSGATAWARCNCSTKTKRPSRRAASTARRSTRPTSNGCCSTAGALPARQRRDDEPLRISLAGARENRAAPSRRPLARRGATPTTHILKLPLGLIGHRRSISIPRWRTSGCVSLLAAYGLPVSSARIATFGAQKVLAVERFDRAVSRTGALLPAAGGFLPGARRCAAFQVRNRRRPGVREIADPAASVATGRADIDTFLAAQIVWMMAAPDGHAKNFSLRLLPGGRFQLAPLYDVMSIWPVAGDGGNQWSWHKASLAMAVWGKSRHYRMRDVKRAFQRHGAALSHGSDAECYRSTDRTHARRD
jgi:serine/threonine-protein kinase HipA